MVNDDGNIKVIFIEFPILGPMSNLAAKAALAANKQGKYMDFSPRINAITRAIK